MLLFTYNPHDTFKRDGVNIYFEHNINFSQAALGDDIEIETVDGKKHLKVQPGTQTGTVLSIKGVGVPFINNPSKRGDQFVKLNIVTPVNLSDEEKKIFYRLAEIQKEKQNKESFIDKVKDVFTGSGK